MKNQLSVYEKFVEWVASFQEDVDQSETNLNYKEIIDKAREIIQCEHEVVMLQKS